MKQMSFIYTSLKSKLACLKVPNRYPSEFGIPSTPPSLPSLLFPAPLLSYTNLPLQFGQWLLLTSRKLLTTTTALRRRWRQAANLVYRENNSTLITNGHSLFQCHIWKLFLYQTDCKQAANLVYRENNSTLITNGHSLFQCHIWKLFLYQTDCKNLLRFF